MIKFSKNTFVILLFIILNSCKTEKKSLNWIGGPTTVIELGSFKILTDPMFSKKGKKAFLISKHPSTGEENIYIERNSEPNLETTNNIDVLLISHLHADHFDKEAREKIDKKTISIVPQSNFEIMKQWGFNQLKSMVWGDTIIEHKGNEKLQIIAVEAMHAGNENLNHDLGIVNGYIIEYIVDNNIEYRIYWSGDTVWFDEIVQLKKFGRIDLFIPNMGAVGADGAIGRRGMNSEDCYRIVKTIEPKIVIPIHHSTFSHYIEPISELKHEFEINKDQARLKILEENEQIDLP